MAKEQVEVTVVKRMNNGKAIFMQVTADAYQKNKRHFASGGWVEASDEEKENFYKGKLVVKKKETAKKAAAKPKAAPADAPTAKE